MLGLILVAATDVMSAWFVFAGPVPLLDGWQRPFVMDRARAATEPVIFTVIVVSVAILVRRHMTMLFWAVCLAAVLMMVTPMAKLAVRGNSTPSAEADEPLLPHLTLSSEMNIIHVMFDSLHTDVFERILADDGNLKAAFDGFNHYPDNVGNSLGTLTSLPSLRAGRDIFDHHEPGANVISELDGLLREHSIMTHLTKQGYEASAILPTELLCRGTPLYCKPVSQLREAVDEWKMNTRSLVVTDLVLLRIAPTFLKPLVYNQGRLLLSRRPHVERDIIRSVRLAEILSKHMTVATDRPVYQFLYFLPPHPPFFSTR